MGTTNPLLMRCFGRPRGTLGRLGGRIMAAANGGCGRWAAGLLELRPEAHVLEVGFGSGKVVRYLATLVPRGYVAGADPSPVMLAQAQSRNAAAVESGHVDLRDAEVPYLPFADERFDAVLSINSMQVWPDATAGLRELWRVLRPGGRVALGFTPQSGQKKDGLVDLLGAAGFTAARTVEKERWICALAEKP